MSTASPSQGMTGLQQAIDGRDPWWWDGAMRAVKHLAATGEPFDAWDVTELGVPDPDHPARWGALFTTARRAGLIVAVGYRESRRPSRAHGVCRVWRGAS